MTISRPTPQELDELARDELAQAQRAARAATRAELEAKFAGDPIAARELYLDWLPLIEFQEDMRTPPVDERDSIIRNQGLDSDW